MPKIDLNIATNIYCWKITENEADLLRLVSLDDFEKTHIQSHKQEKRRKELIVSRILLQLVHPNAHIHYDNKKPVLINSNNEISISNSKNKVVIQINPPKLKTGIDLQYYSDTVLRVKHKFLHPIEKNFLDVENIQILNLIWSAKETLYKAYSEDKLEFKKHLICKHIDKNKIKGIIQQDYSETEFELGVKTAQDYVLTWFIG